MGEKHKFGLRVLAGDLRFMFVLQDVNGQVSRIFLNCRTGGVESMHARSWKGDFCFKAVGLLKMNFFVQDNRGGGPGSNVWLA